MADRIEEIDSYLQRLFPMTRSLTGPGNRETLKVLSELIDLNIQEYPSGDTVYDWEIPPEWTFHSATVRDANGCLLLDAAESNVHVMSYSEPVDSKFSLKELNEHLHSLPELPDAIPYRTSYYRRQWGLCISESKRATLSDFQEPFHVQIDSSFSNGSMTVADYCIRGTSSKEILISTYFCHPSLANDNLSGCVLTAFLARAMQTLTLRYSYRFVFVPETIGAIAYAARNEEKLKDIDFGLVVTTVGGPGKLGMKASWDDKHFLNQYTKDVLGGCEDGFLYYPFDIHGSDERQYSSPGFRINTVSITKDKYYEYPYYHTSLDNLDFVSAKSIEESLSAHLALIDKIESAKFYINTNPHGEAMLSKRGLYPDTGGAFMPGTEGVKEIDAILWLLWHCDGCKPLDQIADFTGVPLSALEIIATKLEAGGLLKEL
jgi:aminopeptidase-like protein